MQPELLKVSEAPGYASSGSDRIKVFYNVYANPADDAAMHRAKDYVKEQMALIIPDRHQVLIRSIGAKFKVNNATHIQHDNGGNEVVTLKLLWKYCQEKPSEKVVYLHNKGSFHPSKENDLLRKWLTRAALSEECASMPLSCNVCSWRMSPLAKSMVTLSSMFVLSEYWSSEVGQHSFGKLRVRGVQIRNVLSMVLDRRKCQIVGRPLRPLVILLRNSLVFWRQVYILAPGCQITTLRPHKTTMVLLW